MPQSDSVVYCDVPELPPDVPELPPDVPELPPDVPELPPDAPELPPDVPELPFVPELPEAPCLLDFFFDFFAFLCDLLSSPEAPVSLLLWPDMPSALRSTSAAREGLVLSLTPSLLEVCA